MSKYKSLMQFSNIRTQNILRALQFHQVKPWEFSAFCRFEMNAHKPFSLCGYSFQNELGIQRDGSSFGPGSSNRGGERPVGRGFQRRRRCLGRKNPMKPEVSWHTILLARSSVLYLWRPWVAERGCSGREQALSVSHRTGGFWCATR